MSEARQQAELIALGNFRWFILFACCMCNAISWGTLYSCGVLYSSWTREFKTTSKAFISLVGALPLAISCGLGPLFGMIIGKYGYRSSCIFGGLLMSLGWILSSFMNSIQGLLITFGLLTGFGGGLANFAGANAMNDYFIKDRVFGEGWVGTALCIGLFVSTELLQKLTERFSWKGAMLISGALNLHLCAIGMFLIRPDQAKTHPLNFWRQKSSERKHNLITVVEDHNQNIEKKPDGMEQKEQKAQRRSFLQFLQTSVRLWRRPAFIFLIMSDTLSWTASFIPFVHLVERARVLNIDDDTSAWINSFAGIGGAVGKVSLSWFFQKIKIHPLYAYGITQTLEGLITIFSPFWSTVEGLFVYATLFGFLSGGYGFLKASVALILGREQYGVSFSWFLLIEGFGIAFGPTIGGYLYAYTLSYTSTFMFSGTLIFVSGIMCVWKKTILVYDTRREEERKTKRSLKLHVKEQDDSIKPTFV